MSTPVNPAAGAGTADAIAAAVATCPAVASLHAGGVARRTVTYLPGRRIDGVRIGDDRVAVSVVGIQGIPVSILADQVRAVVTPFAAGWPVDVHVVDLQPLESQPPALLPGPSA